MSTVTQQPESGVGDIFLQAIDIASDHPALAGHFPGQPIVPGVVLLDQVLIALARWQAPDPTAARCEIVSAKFLSAVAPGEPLQLTAQRQTGDGVDKIGFDINSGERRIATGTLRLYRT